VPAARRAPRAAPPAARRACAAAHPAPRPACPPPRLPPAPRAVYELESVGLDGKTKLFQKPWAMTLTMFVGAATARRGGRRRAALRAAPGPPQQAFEPSLGASGAAGTREHGGGGA
jgi:hypothetical protein